MWRTWRRMLLGAGLAIGLGLAAGLPAAAQDYDDEYPNGYDDYYGYTTRDLQRRPAVRVPPTPPPPPEFGPARPVFPHDTRVWGARWYLFSPQFKGFPRWSGYNDTYPRGTGTEYFYARPDLYY